MEKLITIYHGSDHIIEKPIFGSGKCHNDFGLGFYCTESNELAKEWAVCSLENGFVNQYTLNTEYMNLLNLNSSQYTILNWIAVLIEHRMISIKTPVARRAREYLTKHFSINVNAYDVIIVYRADDSYFDYAETFINNGITVAQLAKAMKLGKLGEQIVLKSQFAFDQLHYEGFEVAEQDKYYVLRNARNTEANLLYQDVLEQDDQDGSYIQDIIKGGVSNDDPRIPRNVSQ